MHIKGYSAPETKAAAERMRSLIEQTEVLGERPEDPLLMLTVLYGFWIGNLATFNGDALQEVAAQFMAVAEKHGTTTALLIAHRLVGCSLLLTGNMTGARAHHDQAVTLYDPAEHHQLATRFGQDAKITALTHRSWTQWLLGYPEAALADAYQALSGAREIGHAATMMNALIFASVTCIQCGNYPAAQTHADELVALADEKGALMWKALGILAQGCFLAATAKASDAVRMITIGLNAETETGATLWMPTFVSFLAKAHAELGKFDDAWRCIGEAMTAVETTKERWFEADILRIAGEIALMSPEPDTPKAEAYFERALAVARQQQAKSWELRASVSLARLWRNQGKVQQARELLAPVYGWFTEGFDTRDLKDAKALLEELQ